MQSKATTLLLALNLALLLFATPQTHAHSELEDELQEKISRLLQDRSFDRNQDIVEISASAPYDYKAFQDGRPNPFDPYNQLFVLGTASDESRALVPAVLTKMALKNTWSFAQQKLALRFALVSAITFARGLNDKLNSGRGTLNEILKNSLNSEVRRDAARALTTFGLPNFAPSQGQFELKNRDLYVALYLEEKNRAVKEELKNLVELYDPETLKYGAPGPARTLKRLMHLCESELRDSY